MTKSENYFPGDSIQQLIAVYDSLKIAVPGNVLLTYLTKNDHDIYAKMMYASQLYDNKNYAACGQCK